MADLHPSSSTRRFSQAAQGTSDHGQVDQILDSVFADLEHHLESDPLPQLPELEDYPYASARPPLRARPTPAKGWLLTAAMMTAAILSGVAFWLSNRPQEFASDREQSPILANADPTPVGELRRSPLDPSQFGLDLLGTEADEAESPSDPALTSEEEITSPNPTGGSTIGGTSNAPAPTSAAAPPQAPAPATAPAPTTVLPASAPQMKLVGIVHEPGEPLALILVDGVVRQVPVGHTVRSGWLVTSIAPQGVGVSNGRNRYLLQLGLGQVL